MNKLFSCLALSTLTTAVAAQAPVFEPMPEGSRDAFFGLGLALRPSYSGSALRRVQVEPVVQVAWSQGLFVSGMQAGWHLGDAADGRWPRVEWGPLLGLRPPRSEEGQGWFVDSPGALGALGGGPGVAGAPAGGRLRGMDPMPGRIEWGGFINLRWSPQWRLTQTLLSGAGRQRRGGQWSLDLHYTLPALADHHSLAWSMGASWANAAFQRSFYGVTEAESLRGSNPAYRPGSGWNELRTQLRWNWSLSPQWVLSSAVQASRLYGEAARSPLVERAGGASFSSALVFRY